MRCRHHERRRREICAGMQSGEPQTWTCCSKAVCTAQPEAQDGNQGPDNLAPAEVHVSDQSGSAYTCRIFAADVHHHVTRAADMLKSTFFQSRRATARRCTSCCLMRRTHAVATWSRLWAAIRSVWQISRHAPKQNRAVSNQCASVEASAVHLQQSLLINASQACACLAHQATVYDGQHLGSHIGVTVHFTNEATEHSYGGVHSWSPFQIQHAARCATHMVVRTRRHPTGVSDTSLCMPAHRVCRPAPGLLPAAGHATVMAMPAW